MPSQVATGELGERTITINRTRLAKPVTNEHERVLPTHRWSTDDQPSNRRQREQVNECLSLRTDASGRDPFSQSVTVERALVGQRPLHHSDTALGCIPRYSLLGEPPGVRRLEPRRRQRLEPGIVVATDKVQGSAVQPSDKQRAGVRQLRVHVRGGQARAPRTDGEARAAFILGLDR